MRFFLNANSLSQAFRNADLCTSSYDDPVVGSAIGRNP
jgi:hypothetical protein